MTSAEWHKDRVARCGCVICWLRLGKPEMAAELHHVSEGSGLRSDFAVAPLCTQHHTGPGGFHKLGTKRFCSLYRIPGETEYGLLVLTNEALARLRI